MPCYRPHRITRDGYGALDFKDYHRLGSHHVNVPCGKCVGCRANAARDWALRCYHEGQSHKRLHRDPDTGHQGLVPNSCVATLTYDDPNHPKDGLLRKKDVQDFLKRLRKNTGAKLRYFYCGEYGGLTGRCHYHMLLFGYDAPDKTPLHNSRLFADPFLQKTWAKGNVIVDQMSFDATRYVAGYAAKKITTGGDPRRHVWVTDPVTGETRLEDPGPEFRNMSRGGRQSKADAAAGVPREGGLGRAWIEANYLEVYREDCIRIGEFKYRPPGVLRPGVEGTSPGSPSPGAGSALRARAGYGPRMDS